MPTDQHPASADPRLSDGVFESLCLRASGVVQRARALNVRVKAVSLNDADISRATIRLRAELAGLTEFARGRATDEAANAQVERALMHPEPNGPQAMNAAEARALRDIGVDDAEAASRVMQAVSADPRGGSALKALRESAEWRRIVNGGARNERDENERATSDAQTADDQFADFAPLLRWISSEASPSLKAELTAKMELYVRSGHALRDCVEPVDASHPQTLAAAAMRALHEQWTRKTRMPRGHDEQAAETARRDRVGALSVMTARFSEIFERYRVERIEEASGEAHSIAHPIPREQGAAFKEGLDTIARRAGSGEIDAAVRDARDPTVLHITVTTADITTRKENNQAARHYDAVLNGIRSGDIEGVQVVKPMFCVLSMLYGQTAPDGKELRGDFIGSLTTPPTAAEREALNVLPFLAMCARVDRGHHALDVASFAQFDVCLIGANADGWNRRMQAVCAIEDGVARREAFLTAASETAGTAIEVMARKDPAKPLVRSSGANLPMLGTLCEALEGITRHAIDCPNAVRAIEARQDVLARVRMQLTRDSEIPGRLGDISAKFEDGFDDWAQRCLRREAKEKALLAAAQPAPAVQTSAVHASSVQASSVQASATQATPVQAGAMEEAQAAPRERTVAAINPELLWAAQREQIAYRDARFVAITEAIVAAAGDRDSLPADEIRQVRDRIAAQQEAAGVPLTKGDQDVLDRWLTPYGVAVVLGERNNMQLVQEAALGNQARVIALLERGADPNAHHEGVGAIAAARSKGHYDIADLLGRVMVGDVATERRAYAPAHAEQGVAQSSAQQAASRSTSASASTVPRPQPTPSSQAREDAAAAHSAAEPTRRTTPAPTRRLGPGARGG